MCWATFIATLGYMWQLGMPKKNLKIPELWILREGQSQEQKGIKLQLWNHRALHRLTWGI